jgi:anti-sigma factor (TIGR02949 family)
MFDGSGNDGFRVSPPTKTNHAEPGSCDDYSVETLRYLDGDLEGQELEVFRSHLSSCLNCREHLEKEKALSQLLRRARPLYTAPASLRTRVSTAVESSPSISAVTNRLARDFLQPVTKIRSRFLRLPVLVPAALALVLCLAFLPGIVRNVRAASYAETAVAEHRSYLSGRVPAGLTSNSPQQVAAWFAGRVPFDFRLPDTETAPKGKAVYRLTGASVVNYSGSPAALVMYDTPSEKISLLVDSSKVATVAGGDEVRFGDLIFHYRDESGFRVITWTNHGLSYALVSSVSGPAGASCLVCHQNMADRGHFKAVE